MELRIVADLDAIAEEAAGIFADLHPASVALSGGRTPRRVYERLATPASSWRSVEVFFGDERCVAPDHPDSNYGMANEALLSKVEANVHPMSGCDARAYERELAEVFGEGLPRFDLVFLGLGEDGHTASLFPGDPALLERDRRVLPVERPDHGRLTLTMPVLSAARVAMFLVSGVSKIGALQRLLNGEDIPATQVKAERVVVLADVAAAGAR